ncbi:hypothetical protein CsSME_00032015 [Camellia sinensis var. sinensis]
MTKRVSRLQFVEIEAMAVCHSFSTIVLTVVATTTAGESLSFALLGLKASKAFFSDFTNSIFNAPMLFFDSTPVGQILT